MPKLEDINNQVQEVMDGAGVKQSAQEAKTFNTTLRNVPEEWRDKLKAEGFTFTGYARNAVRRCMIQDGLLKP